METVIVCGQDGYLSHALVLRLKKKGYNVIGFDNLSRRLAVKEMGSFSAIPIDSINKRNKLYKQYGTGEHHFIQDNIAIDYKNIIKYVKKYKPKAIINLAQQPSAPYSHIDRKHIIYTAMNNIIGMHNIIYAIKEGSLETHLITIGSMGEYDHSAGLPIYEGLFDLTLEGKTANVIYPRRPGSVYHSCYSDNTEVLTDIGWIYFEDLNKLKVENKNLPKIATLNQNFDCLEYQSPKEIFKYEAPDEMIRIKNRRVDLLVTPNHKIFEYSNRTANLKKWRLTEAQNLYNKSCVMKKSAGWFQNDTNTFILPSCSVKISAHSFKPELEKIIQKSDWLNFFGWWISEGSLYKNNIIIAQNNEENFTDIKNSILNLGLKRKIQTNKRKVNEELKIIGFSIKCAQLAKYLKQFKTSHYKYIPREILNYTSKQNLQILLNSLMGGDGYIKKKDNNGNIIKGTYYTASKQLADDIQEICLKCGLSTTMNIRSKTEYAISITNLETTQFIMSPSVCSNRKKSLYNKEKGLGFVYCCEVPNNIIFVRRNGKSVWSGNSKVASSYDIDCACRWYGMKATDMMQAVVYSNWTPEIEETGSHTRLDSDESFGTIINRFIVQAVLREPLTVYGKGEHSRGFLALNDSIQCLMLAIENPPKRGEYRTWNQLAETFTMNQIAEIVQKACPFLVTIDHIPTPRKEKTDYFEYDVRTDKLKDIGFKQTREVEQEVKYAVNLLKDRDDIFPLKDVVIPKIKWEK